MSTWTDDAALRRSWPPPENDLSEAATRRTSLPIPANGFPPPQAPPHALDYFTAVWRLAAAGVGVIVTALILCTIGVVIAVREMRPEVKIVEKMISPPLVEFSSCIDALRSPTGDNGTGIFTFTVRDGLSKRIFRARCEQEMGRGGWMVFQRRGQFGNSDRYFYRDFAAYKTGFGDLDGEYWLGLDAVQAVAREKPHELLVRMVHGDVVYLASYDRFELVGNEFALQLGEFIGRADNGAEMEDGLGWLNGSSFSAVDWDRDANSGKNCAEERVAGYW
jgi:ficolin